MIDISKDLAKPVFQHLIPVLVLESGRVLGYVQTAYTMFMKSGKYKLWQDGFAVQLDCVTQHTTIGRDNKTRNAQYLAIVYKQHEINKRFTLKNFISAESQQRQYVSRWISIKSGALNLNDSAIFEYVLTGTMDTSADYENAYKKNFDESTELPIDKKAHHEISWCLKLPLSRFKEQYDYVSTDWLKMFYASLAKRNLQDTPIRAELVPIDNIAGIKTTLITPVLEASSSADKTLSTLPSELQVMKLKQNVAQGIQKFMLIVHSLKSMYNITVKLQLTAS